MKMERELLPSSFGKKEVTWAPAGGDDWTGKVVRQACHPISAAQGEHLGELFQVLMPDGRLRSDWQLSVWEQYVAVNMTDTKRLFTSNRRFDRYGRPKSALFAPYVFESPLLVSEEAHDELKAQLSTAHLQRAILRGWDPQGQDTDEPETRDEGEAAREGEGETETEGRMLVEDAGEVPARAASAGAGFSSSDTSSSTRASVREIARGGIPLWPMDMETIESRVKGGRYNLVEELELDVILVGMNALATEVPTRDAMKAVCSAATGEIPSILPPVMPSRVVLTERGSIGAGVRGWGFVRLSWNRCNYLGHLSRAEAEAAAGAAPTVASGTRQNTAAASGTATRRNTTDIRIAVAMGVGDGRLAATRATTRQSTAAATEGPLRERAIIEYQVRIQPLPFPKPFKELACACVNHDRLPYFETDGMDMRELAVLANNAGAGAAQAAALRETKLKGLSGRARQEAVASLERCRSCKIIQLQPAHDYEIKVRAFVTSPPVAGAKGARARAYGTWSKSMLVRTLNAPPSAPCRVHFDTVRETSVYVRWEAPELLHGGHLVNYEITLAICAIGNVMLSRTSNEGKESQKHQAFFEALRRLYHGDKRLSEGGRVTPGLWALGHTITPLLPATLLEIAVRAKNTEGWGEVSNVVSIRTLSAHPDSPQDVCHEPPLPQPESLRRGARGMRSEDHDDADQDNRTKEEIKRKSRDRGPSFWMQCRVSWAAPSFSNSPEGILRYEVAIEQLDPRASSQAYTSCALDPGAHIYTQVRSVSL
jgi:hypothetical protein